MKFKIAAKKFSDLFITGPYVYTVYVKDNILTIQTAHEFLCERRASVDADNEGAFGLPKDFPAKLKGFAPADILECEVSDNILRIKCGRFNARYKTCAYDEDHSIDFDAFADIIKLNAAQVQAIQNLRVFTVKNNADPRMEFSGVDFYLDNNSLRLSATDRSHLAVYRFDVDKTDTKMELILPSNIVSNFKYFADGAYLFYNDTTQKVLLHDDSTMLVFSPTQGHFPDLNNVVDPLKQAKKLPLDTSALADAVTKLLSLGEIFTMQFTQDNIQVSAVNREGEDAVITLDYANDERPESEFKYSFAANAFMNYLKLSNTSATFYYKDEKHPVLFSEPNLDYVEAPIR